MLLEKKLMAKMRTMPPPDQMINGQPLCGFMWHEESQGPILTPTFHAGFKTK